MPHSTRVNQQLIVSFGWEQMNHPPYSPDLAPSDFHLFLHLKRFLSGLSFDDYEEVKDAITSWVTSQVATFCDAGIQNLVSRESHMVRDLENKLAVEVPEFDVLPGNLIPERTWELEPYHDGISTAWTRSFECL
ncbi:hypothetical protein AVEN_4031-1 [Araneus ventricosus]|uniref:Histone-lysine N-methyltransferase SETMAR n=1 Tax=Araneus ventricosus TaxID=182803 RepID=A0A4Y2J6Y3_ARAVE|nr:hypothetical protein AVEN_4031-1 [Araneus ventricosus]